MLARTLLLCVRTFHTTTTHLPRLVPGRSLPPNPESDGEPCRHPWGAVWVVRLLSPVDRRPLNSATTCLAFRLVYPVDNGMAAVNIYSSQPHRRC